MMRTAAIAYRNDELEAWERDDLWTVRLSNLETRARYLDLALARLLGDAPEAHRAAARLLVELADVVEQQEAAYSQVVAGLRRQVWPKPLLLGFLVDDHSGVGLAGRRQHGLHADDLVGHTQVGRQLRDWVSRRRRRGRWLPVHWPQVVEQVSVPGGTPSVDTLELLERRFGKLHEAALAVGQ